VVTEVLDGSRLYAQVVGSEVEALEELVHGLQVTAKDDDDAGGFVADAFNPRVGDIVRARFTEDNTWYRAKILEKQGEHARDSKYRVLYVDYGNSETVPFAQLRPLPPSFASLPAQAQEVTLAFLKTLPVEEEFGHEAQNHLRDLVLGRQLTASVEFRDGAKLYVALADPESHLHVNSALVKAGLARVDKRHRRQKSPLFLTLLAEEQSARTSRVGLWHQGDAPDSDEDEDVTSTRRKSAWGGSRPKPAPAPAKPAATPAKPAAAPAKGAPAAAGKGKGK